MSTFVRVNLTFLLLLFHKEWDSIFCDAAFPVIHFTFNFAYIVIFNELVRFHLSDSLLLGRQFFSVSTSAFDPYSLYHARHTANLGRSSTKSSIGLPITRFKLAEARFALAALEVRF